MVCDVEVCRYIWYKCKRNWGGRLRGSSLGDIALSLEFLRELLLVVVEEGGVGDDDDWDREPHCVEDGAGACGSMLANLYHRLHERLYTHQHEL